MRKVNFQSSKIWASIIYNAAGKYIRSNSIESVGYDIWAYRERMYVINREMNSVNIFTIIASRFPNKMRM